MKMMMMMMMSNYHCIMINLMNLLLLFLLTQSLLLTCKFSDDQGGMATLIAHAQPPLIFLPSSATQQGAVCLDGTAPAYSIDAGSGSGANKWIVHLQGGGWCGSLSDCLDRSNTNLGSSDHMTAFGFGGFLSNSPTQNPDFYDWNRVHVRYCDGGSFQGDVASGVQATSSSGQEKTLYFRGQRIWDAVIDDLLNKGLRNAEKAILSGDSAGGSAAFFQCNRFRSKLSASTDVKCLSDGGFFMDIPNIAGVYSFREFFQAIVQLHNIALPRECTSRKSLGECFFPHNNLGFIEVPIFFVQSAYDSFQVQYILAPPGAYSNGYWDACRQSLSACSNSQLSIITDKLRGQMLSALQPLIGSKGWGMHVVSCYYHTEAIDANLWNGITQINGKNIAQAVHSWYFEGNLVQLIDCPYPCNPTCTNP